MGWDGKWGLLWGRLRSGLEVQARVKEGESTAGCTSVERQWGGDRGTQVVLAHGVAETQHLFVLGPAPPLSLRAPSCHHPQLPSIREDPRAGCLWWWLGLQKEAADCVTPREWCPQGKGSRREGADHHQNIQLPLSICPYYQVPHTHQCLGLPSAWPPLWIIPTLFPSTSQVHSISGVSHGSQGTMDSHGRPGASLACGSADTSSPPSFTSGADGAPSLGYLSPHFCLPDCICLSVYHTELSPPTGPAALPGVSRDGDLGVRCILISQLWVSCGVTAWPQPHCKEGHRRHPCYRSHSTLWVLPRQLESAQGGQSTGVMVDSEHKVRG